MNDDRRDPTPLPSMHDDAFSDDAFSLPAPLGPMGGDQFVHSFSFEDVPIAMLGAMQLRNEDQVTMENQHDLFMAVDHSDEPCEGCGNKHSLIQVHYFARTRELADRFEQRMHEVAMELGLLDRRQGGAKPN